NGEQRATNFLIDNSESAPGQSGYLGDSHNLEYVERSVVNLLLNGTHYLNETQWKIDCKISPNLSKIDDTDIRNVTSTLGGPPSSRSYTFNAGAGGFPSRLWRSMDEVNLVGRAKISRDYELVGESAKLKFGGSYVYKQRDYEIFSY